MSASSTVRFGLVCALGLATGLSAQPQAILPVVNDAATMEDRLGSMAELDVEFKDESGASVVLRDLVSGTRPIILNLGYFGCPHACGPIYNAIVDGLQNADLQPGTDVDILSISINEEETPDIAKRKKAAFLEILGRQGAERGWHFLTGELPAIRRVADSVGYRFQRVEGINNIDHPPTLMFLGPDGKLTRLVNGITMTPVTLRRAVIESGQGKVGSFIERILLSCLTFDPSSEAYTMTAWTIMQIGCTLTVLALGSMIFVLWRRERLKPKPAVHAAS